MEPLIITLKKKRKEGLFFFYINGIRHDDFLSHETRVDCLKRANTAFDHDFETVASQFKDHKYGAYLWCFTSEFLRGEEITGLLRLHYLQALIENLIDNHSIKRLIIETPLPAHLRLFFKKLDIDFQYKWVPLIYTSGKYIIISIARILKSMLKNLKFLFTKSNPSFTGVLADINKSFTKHRYDNIDKIIAIYPEIRFFSGQEHRLLGIPYKDTVVFRKETNLNIILNSIWESFKISAFILKNKTSIPIYLYKNLSSTFNLIMFVDLLIYKNCVENYLNNNRVNKFIHVSTLTRPTYRILMSIAKKNKIEFILVASRTLMSYRSSERMLSCDVKGINNASLPDWFVFKDLYSTKIFNNYPEQQKKVFIGGRFLNQSINVIEDKPSLALLVLFNHTKDLSFKLLKEIKKIDLNNSLETIIYRCHSGYYIDTNTIQSFFPDRKIIDISGKDYLPLTNFRTIAISGPTTGALEAIQAGAVILWAPYIWDNGILLDDMMNNVGVKCENNEKLNSVLNSLVDSKDVFDQQLKSDAIYSNKYFNTNRLISDVLKKKKMARLTNINF